VVAKLALRSQREFLGHTTRAPKAEMTYSGYAEIPCSLEDRVIEFAFLGDPQQAVRVYHEHDGHGNCEGRNRDEDPPIICRTKT